MDCLNLRMLKIVKHLNMIRKNSAPANPFYKQVEGSCTKNLCAHCCKCCTPQIDHINRSDMVMTMLKQWGATPNAIKSQNYGVSTPSMAYLPPPHPTPCDAQYICGADYTRKNCEHNVDIVHIVHISVHCTCLSNITQVVHINRHVFRVIYALRERRHTHTPLNIWVLSRMCTHA